MDFFVNLGETTLKTQYCRDHKSVKICLKTGIGKKQKLMIEIFGIPRDCKRNLLLTDYEITTMADDYIGIKPFVPLKRNDQNDKLTLIILPATPLDQKPYNDPIMNRYKYHIRRSIVNRDFFISCYPIGSQVYEKMVYFYDLSFDSYLARHSMISDFNHRQINGKELLFK